jgi:NAD(P)-dependent dehydrogenase (short-subunit alcohol dehydrogenase family)
MGVTIDLSGRIALVTGGGSGIGSGTSAVLAAAGAHVIVADVDDAAAAAIVASIVDGGGAADAIAIDVRDPAAVHAMADEVLATHGHLDVLVNNVGHYIGAQSFEKSEPAHWDALHAVNFAHVLTCTREFLPAMIERGSGSIINVSSVEGLRGYPPDPVYGAYKAAVIHFTRCLALDVAGRGVRVNAIAPDVTQTPQVDYESRIPADQWERWSVWVPVGRVGEPADNADVVLFLASDLSRWVTGHVIPTDGGTLAAGGWFRTSPSGRWTNRPREA